MRSPRHTPLLLVALTSLAPASARADEPDAEATRLGLTVGASAGYVRRARPEGDQDAPRGGVDLLVHYRFVQVGFVLDFGGSVFGADRVTSVAGAVGGRLTFGRVRLDALGVAGAHAYSGVGGSLGLLGTSDPGAEGTLPFLGARVGVSYEWGRVVRFGLGLVAFVEGDLTQRQVTYRYVPSCLWSCGSPSASSTRTGTATLGELHGGVALRLHVLLGGRGR